MGRRVRNHVPALAGLLSVVTLALIFGAVLGVFGEFLPRTSDAVINSISDANALISLLAIGTIALGWRAIRRGEVRKHRLLMVISLVLFIIFLALYFYKIALVGPTTFSGPETIYHVVYLPILAVHIILAIVCIPLLYYVLLLALTHPVTEIPLTNHPRVGRVAASLWMITFALGVVVYLLLYIVY